MAQLTVIANSEDGYVTNSGNTTIEDLRDDPTGTAVVIVGNTVGSSSFAGSLPRFIERGFYAFDTSSVPVGVTVTLAQFNFYVTSFQNFSGNVNMGIIIFKGTQASPTGLTVNDFDAFSDVWSDLLKIGSTGSKSLNLNSTAMADLGFGTDTQICIRQNVNDVILSSNLTNDVRINSTEGGFAKPRLTVQYFSAPSAPTDLETGNTLASENIVINLEPTLKLRAKYVNLATGESADNGTHYQFQIRTADSEGGNLFYDSTKKELDTPISTGNFTEDFELLLAGFQGIPLQYNTTYYWRIRFWNDDGNREGDWSETVGAWKQFKFRVGATVTDDKVINLDS